MIVEFPQRWARKSQLPIEGWVRSARKLLSLGAWQNTKNKESQITALGSRKLRQTRAAKKCKRVLLCEHSKKERLMPRGFGYVLVPAESYENSLSEGVMNSTVSGRWEQVHGDGQAHV